MLSADDVIRLLDLKELPQEGGLFRETYRSSEILPADALPRCTGRRCLCTDIFYLLRPGMVSHLHRLASDEVYHFQLGQAVTMLHLYPDGSSKLLTLGSDLAAGQQLQVVVPRNVWQGAFLPSGEFALMSVTVAPGFEYADFEVGQRAELIAQYPDQAEAITRLT